MVYPTMPRTWDLMPRESGIWPVSPTLSPYPRTEAEDEGDDAPEFTSLYDIALPRRQSPKVIMNMGRRGKGKSAFMALLALMMKLLWEHHGVKRRILSNIRLDIADIEDPYLLEMLDADPTVAEDAIVCVDELTSAFPSQRAISRGNLDFSNILTQTRKLRAEWIFTTQFPQLIDMKILYQVDYFIKCKYLDLRYPSGRVYVDIWDWWGQETGKDWRKPWPPRNDDVDVSRWYPGIKEAFKIYNSDERVPSRWAKNRDTLIQKAWDIERPVEIEGPSDIIAIQGNPRSFQEYLVRIGTKFSVMGVLNAGKMFEKGVITGRKSCEDWLRANGYTVDSRQGDAIAYLPAWAEDAEE